MVASMSRKGDCWDNAAAESFFATLEHELFAREQWATHAEARRAIFAYIETWYNRAALSAFPAWAMRARASTRRRYEKKRPSPRGQRRTGYRYENTNQLSVHIVGSSPKLHTVLARANPLVV